MALGITIPHGYCTRTSALLSRASCTSCLAAPPLATSARTHLWPRAPSRPLRWRGAGLVPLSVRYRRVNRRPGVDEEGRGEGLRRCGARPCLTEGRL